MSAVEAGDGRCVIVCCGVATKPAPAGEAHSHLPPGEVRRVAVATDGAPPGAAVTGTAKMPRAKAAKK